MNERILVTGATGKVGRELVRRLADEDVEVLAATRHPDAARAELGEAQEVVELDYAFAETYDAPLEWADRVFVVAPPFDPDASQTLASFVDWAVQAGVGHVVLLSAMGTERRDDLALARVEALVRETGVRWTFLRPNVYMQNFHPGFLGAEIRRSGEFALPAGDARVSLVDARDVAAVAARVLTSGEHGGAAYTLTGPDALSHREVAAILADVTGREVRYTDADEEEARRRLLDLGWERDRARTVVEFFRSIRDGERERTTPDVKRLLGHPARSFREFAREHADAWRAGAPA